MQSNQRKCMNYCIYCWGNWFLMWLWIGDEQSNKSSDVVCFSWLSLSDVCGIWKKSMSQYVNRRISEGRRWSDLLSDQIPDYSQKPEAARTCRCVDGISACFGPSQTCADKFVNKKARIWMRNTFCCRAQRLSFLWWLSHWDIISLLVQISVEL